MKLDAWVFWKTVVVPTLGYLGTVGFAAGTRLLRLYVKGVVAIAMATGEVLDVATDRRDRWDDYIFGHLLVIASLFLAYPLSLQPEAAQGSNLLRLQVVVLPALLLYLILALMVAGFAAVRWPIGQASPKEGETAATARRRANVLGVLAWALTISLLYLSEVWKTTDA